MTSGSVSFLELYGLYELKGVGCTRESREFSPKINFFQIQLQKNVLNQWCLDNPSLTPCRVCIRLRKRAEKQYPDLVCFSQLLTQDLEIYLELEKNSLHFSFNDRYLQPLKSFTWKSNSTFRDDFRWFFFLWINYKDHENLSTCFSYVVSDIYQLGWVCLWFSSLLREVFLRVLRFSPLLKNQQF